MNFESDVTVLPDFNTSDESIEREAAAAAGMTDPNYLNGGAPPLDPNYAPQPPAGPAPGAPAPGMPPAGAPQPGTPAPGGAPGYPPGTPFPGAPGAAPYPGAPQPGQPQPGAPAGQPGQAPPIDPFARFRGPDGRLNEQAIAAEFLRRENHTNSVLARMDQAIASGGGLSAEQLAQMRQQQQQQQAPQGGQAPPQAGPTLEDKLKAFYAEVGEPTDQQVLGPNELKMVEKLFGIYLEDFSTKVGAQVQQNLQAASAAYEQNQREQRQANETRTNRNLTARMKAIADFESMEFPDISNYLQPIADVLKRDRNFERMRQAEINGVASFDSGTLRQFIRQAYSVLKEQELRMSGGMAPGGGMPMATPPGGYPAAPGAPAPGTPAPGAPAPGAPAPGAPAPGAYYPGAPVDPALAYRMSAGLMEREGGAPPAPRTPAEAEHYQRTQGFTL